MQVLKYGNIILTGLILVYPKKFFQLIYKNCKRPTRAEVQNTKSKKESSSKEGDLLFELVSNEEDQQVVLKFKAACQAVRKE